jgi:hypothetical protein
MTRVWMGVLAVWLAAAPAVAGGSGPRVGITRDETRAVVTLRGSGVTVTETLTREAIDLRLATPADVLRVQASLAGAVVIERNGARRSFSMQRATFDDHAAVRALIDGSPALAAFDTVLRSDWAQRSPEATLFTSARALLRVFEGDAAAVTTMAAAAPPALAATIAPVRQKLSPSQCWDTYSRDVTKFTYDLQACLSMVSANWWNPFHTAWCAYEYNLKSSLAAFWLADCFGVPV